MIHKDKITTRWVATLDRQGGGDPESYSSLSRLLTLEGQYKTSDTPRAYHTIDHVMACFDVLDRVFPKSPLEVEFALWYHDCVYNSREHDNEERSAHFASIELSDLCSQNFRDNVTELILATKHNALPKNDLEKILVDVDLSILGESPEVFDLYERQIREEYNWVPEEGFRAGRIKVLEGFLNRDWIYSNPIMRKNGYEGRAQENLRRSLAALGAVR